MKKNIFIGCNVELCIKLNIKNEISRRLELQKTQNDCHTENGKRREL